MSIVFTYDDGLYQGRIPVDDAPQGSYVYELGHALPNQWVRLQGGDSNSLVQTADYSTTPFTRVSVKIRAPEAGYSASAAWTLRIYVGAEEYTSIQIDRDRTLSDVALPTLSADASGSGAASVSFVLGFATNQSYPTVELPSVQIDAVVLDADASAVILANRSPEPSEVEVPVGGLVSFTLLSGGTDTVGYPDVYVDGDVVFTGGGGENGWSGSFEMLKDGLSAIVTLTPPADLDPFTTYTVRAVYPGIDSTWAFRTVDTVGPSISLAQATDERLVRVVFDEGVTTTAQAYSITLVSGPIDDGVVMPAVAPSVRSAAVQADGSVLLTLAIEMTPGATYQVTCSGVTDLLGNAIVGATYTFTGYQPHVPSNRDFDLYGMLLEYDRQNDETKDLKRFVGCLQEVTNLLLTKIDRLIGVVDIDSAPEAWLDKILRDMGNPFGFDMTLHDKRKLARVLVAIYRGKGTDKGLIQAIRFFLGLEVTIATPWTVGWMVGIHTLGVTTTLASGAIYDRYSYQIVSPIYLTSEQRARITAIAKYMQRAPCHLRGIVEPSAPPTVPDHWSLGLSRVGVNTLVH